MEYVDELKNFEELYNMFIYKGEWVYSQIGMETEEED